MSFQDTRRLLSGGEAFLLMLQQFQIEDVSDARLALAEAYADNVVFRPKNVEVKYVITSPYYLIHLTLVTTYL